MTAGDVEVVYGSTAARNCAAFDATDDYILADAHAVARVAANDTVGTYSAWIYLDDIAGDYAILSAGDNDNVNEFLTLDVKSGGTLQIFLKHGGATQFLVVSTAAVITAKKWIHVAVVQNGTQPALYVNGLNVAATNTTATDLTMWYDELTLTDKFAIGVRESNGTHLNDFRGMISDVKYWNRALTATEVFKDKNGEVQVDDATYLQLHLLDGYNGITDQGLGADDGTLTGHAYLCGWGSEWSRQIELNALVADDIQTFRDPNGYSTTLILKAA